MAAPDLVSARNRGFAPDAVMDLHCDLLQELVLASNETNPFRSRWLANLRNGGVRLQGCPIYVPAEERSESGLRFALRQAAALRRAVRSNSDDARLVTTREDLESLAAADRVGLLLTLEGADPLGYDLDLVELFWDLGVRIVTLTRARPNLYGDGNAEARNGGLTALGVELLERLVARGMIIDLAHTSARMLDEILAQVDGRAPVLVTHAACRDLLAAAHNMSDAQLRAVADAGGILGMMALPFVIDHDRWTIDRVIDHLERAVSVMGATRVGLGADFVHQLFHAGALPRLLKDTTMPAGITLESSIEGLQGPEDFPGLAVALERRGWDDALRRAVLCHNVRDYLESALPAGLAAEATTAATGGRPATD